MGLQPKGNGADRWHSDSPFLTNPTDATFLNAVMMPSTGGDAKSLELQQSCFTGSWAGDIVRGGHNPKGDGLTLSAGDLDEGIQSFLIFRDTDKITAGTGATAFENVDAFRAGFFQGEPTCADLVPAS